MCASALPGAPCLWGVEVLLSRKPVCVRAAPHASSVWQALHQASPAAWWGSDCNAQPISGLACVLSGQVGACSGPFCPRRGAHLPSLPPRHREVSALQNKPCSSPSLPPAPALDRSLPSPSETRSAAAPGPARSAAALEAGSFLLWERTGGPHPSTAPRGRASVDTAEDVTPRTPVGRALRSPSPRGMRTQKRKPLLIETQIYFLNIRVWG